MHFTCGPGIGSIPVDLDRGNKTFSLRTAPTQYPMLHVNISLIGHLEFLLPAFQSRKARNENLFSICKHSSNILANNFGCSVFVSQIKMGVDSHDAWCVSTNLLRSDFAALDQHWHCHTNSSANVAEILSTLLQALKVAIANDLMNLLPLTQEKSNSSIFL